MYQYKLQCVATLVTLACKNRSCSRESLLQALRYFRVLIVDSLNVTRLDFRPRPSTKRKLHIRNNNT